MKTHIKPKNCGGSDVRPVLNQLGKYKCIVCRKVMRDFYAFELDAKTMRELDKREPISCGDEGEAE